MKRLSQRSVAARSRVRFPLSPHIKSQLSLMGSFDLIGITGIEQDGVGKESPSRGGIIQTEGFEREIFLLVYESKIFRVR